MIFIKLLKVQSLGGTHLIENPKLYTKLIGLAEVIISIFGFCGFLILSCTFNIDS